MFHVPGFIDARPSRFNFGFISRLIHLADMNILVSHKKINTLVFTMKKELQILYDWMLANRFDN